MKGWFRDEPVANRLAAKLMPIPECGCMVFTGYLNREGYGIIRARKGSGVRGAHRVAYELAKGEIPAGHEIDHKCRVRSCCNPDHLEAVTPRENTLRSNGVTAINARKTHCIRGHLLSEENNRPDTRKMGHRGCKICAALSKRTAHAVREV